MSPPTRLLGRRGLVVPCVAGRIRSGQPDDHMAAVTGAAAARRAVLRRVAFLRVAFLRVAFLRVAFLAAFLRVAFLAVVFLAVVLRAAFLRVAFFRVAFLAVAFLATLRRVAFFRVAFLRVAFLAIIRSPCPFGGPRCLVFSFGGRGIHQCCDCRRFVNQYVRAYRTDTHNLLSERRQRTLNSMVRASQCATIW